MGKGVGILHLRRGLTLPPHRNNCFLPCQLQQHQTIYPQEALTVLGILCVLSKQTFSKGELECFQPRPPQPVFLFSWVEVGSGRRNDLIRFLVMVLKVWFVSQHSGSQPMGLDPFGVQPLFPRGCRSDILHVIYLYYDS